ncbi:2-oxoglutarate-dependent ethylene/succinate-forming enzyme [Roseovarius albus]|uniref:2-oxoglutarate-dependent ethylene/succinate-forming enzyme n=1 Tax=Roseovarius albus TaxID=1247867 RepID=A0A1X6YA67_9RHOB|nr:2-oxoglutarate and iron-dependent oxygenase domain-containing protein [Roseovarius albus]SLN14557.1 2-oxoglutarate-dependent ethylene/succinate-forming enzyme [Roseovarius albus]
MIPEIDLKAALSGDRGALAQMRVAAEDIGFLTVKNTAVSAADVEIALRAYATFFKLPASVKQSVDMAQTGANRGWGASQAEQVDPESNPDYKQVFDCGFELAKDDPLRQSGLGVYAPNQWPQGMSEFKQAITGYYDQALTVSAQILQLLAQAIGEDADFFTDKFDKPMALLRGNYYPPRPAWAGNKDFGIAEHTDYGCLTLLATDGVPGLEVKLRDGRWIPVNATPGTFIVNFGEMLQMWTEGRVVATSHRVIGSKEERLSIPMFYNPNYSTNVAPKGSDQVILAGEHLTRRFDETYVHLQSGT